MRHTHYNRFDVEHGTHESLRFDESHYREAATLSTPLVGMHELTALGLINKWNRNQYNCVRFVYYI
jgi:hypothetical protein